VGVRAELDSVEVRVGGSPVAGEGNVTVVAPEISSVVAAERVVGGLMSV